MCSLCFIFCKLPSWFPRQLRHSVFLHSVLNRLFLLFSRPGVSNSFVTPWTVACQTPLSMGFPRQEYWSGLPFPSPGDLRDPGVKPASPAWQADSLPLSHLGSLLNGLDWVQLEARLNGMFVLRKQNFILAVDFNPLQYSCLENPHDREPWWTAVHGVTKSRTQLSC